MEKFQTGAVRDTGGKGRFDLLPWSAIWRIAKHMEDAVAPDPETGVPHYAERNWECGLPMHSMIDSAFRHLAKYMMGMTDEDHLCAAATNLLMAMWTEDNVSGAQDIPMRKKAAVVAHMAESPSPDSSPEVCDSYVSSGLFVGDVPRCRGTVEYEACNCRGVVGDCDFYPERRGENGES